MMELPFGVIRQIMEKDGITAIFLCVQEVILIFSYILLVIFISVSKICLQGVFAFNFTDIEKLILIAQY